MAFAVVLHHGLMGFDRFRLGPVSYNNWKGIDSAITSLGCDVYTTRVHPTAGVVRRAEQLTRQVNSIVLSPNQRLIMVAHSMGGLDARYAITRLGLERKVAALLTVCTPHHGSSFADYCALRLGRDMQFYRLLAKLGLDISAAMDLTRETCSAFNQKTPDAAQVAYFSVGGAPSRRAVMPMLQPSFRLIGNAEGANDGLVSAASSRWGRFLGDWRADHFMCINKRYTLRQEVSSVPQLYREALLQVLDHLKAARQARQSERRAGGGAAGRVYGLIGGLNGATGDAPAWGLNDCVLKTAGGLEIGVSGVFQAADPP
jgi:triacylglycerol lipase